MPNRLFAGLGTALITPFHEDVEKTINWEALDWLINWQIANGVDFLVPCGTTGEAPTLDHKEHIDVIEFVIAKCAGRLPVLAGTGSNSTKEAIYLTKSAKDAGADGALVVYPYYNKPTFMGTIHHFEAIAKVGLPLVYYHIPGRAPLAKDLDIYNIITQLACGGEIVGIKWSDDDARTLRNIIEVIGASEEGESFSILSGDDNKALETMTMGGHGLISVLSNLLPHKAVDLMRYLQKKDWDGGRKVHEELLPLMKLMFSETNPIPIKTALSMACPDIFSPVFRLPLCAMDDVKAKHLFREIKKMSV
jgi:4-hydroxy-tetrahydrodipicolinate synthase